MYGSEKVNPCPAEAVYILSKQVSNKSPSPAVVFNLFCYQVKLQLLGIKCMLRHQYLQMFCRKLLQI